MTISLRKPDINDISRFFSDRRVNLERHIDDSVSRKKPPERQVSILTWLMMDKNKVYSDKHNTIICEASQQELRATAFWIAKNHLNLREIPGHTAMMHFALEQQPNKANDETDSFLNIVPTTEKYPFLFKQIRKLEDYVLEFYVLLRSAT